MEGELGINFARRPARFLKLRNREDRMNRKSTEDVDDIRLQWEEIARSEVTRQRRRLALLTDEQRLAVESALVSVADHMFEVLVQGAAERPKVDRRRYLNVWRKEAIAA